MAGAVELAKAYRDRGFRAVVATPHYVMGSRWAYKPEIIKANVHQLNTVLLDQNIDLKIYPGMEIALDEALPLSNDLLLGLNGSRFLLVELPFQNIPGNWKQFLDNMLTRGFIPVIAHPERCLELTNQAATLKALVESGVGLQLNWGSLLGRNGSEVELFAWDLLGRGWVHCIATDSHDQKHRSPAIVEMGLQVLENHLTKAQIQTLMAKNPQSILDNQTLTRIAPSEIKRTRPKVKKRWFSFLKRS